MHDKVETLEQWVDRVNSEPIWREVAMKIAQIFSGTSSEKTSFKKYVLDKLTGSFTEDIFSPHWLQIPMGIEISFSRDVINHANVVLLNARTEITKKIPKKEQLWRALYLLYEEAKHQREMVNYLQEKIVELELEKDEKC